MRYRSVAFAVALSAVTAAGAVACYTRSVQLGTDGEFLKLRAKASEDAYASTFDGQYMDQQLATYEQRRQVLERSQLWKRGAAMLSLAAVALLIVGYCLFLLSRLREQLMEVTQESPPAAQIR